MTRFQALLSATGLTTLVLAVLLWGARSTVDAATTTTPTTPTIPVGVEQVSVPTATTSPDVQRLTDENRQLREAVEILLTREAAYQSQIELANQQLREAVAPPVVDANASTGGTTSADGETVAADMAVDDSDEAHAFDRHEGEQHEHEYTEYEHEEHERENDD